MKDYRIIAKDKIFLLYIIGGILLAQTFMQLDLLIPVYTKEKVGLQTVFHLVIGPYRLKERRHLEFFYRKMVFGCLINGGRDQMDDKIP